RALSYLGLVIVSVFIMFSRPYLLKLVRNQEVSPEWLLIGPCMFAILFLVFLGFEFYIKRSSAFTVSDYIHIFFGFLIIALIFPSSILEYQVRKTPHPLSIELIENSLKSKDARMRALAILASSRHNFDK